MFVHEYIETKHSWDFPNVIQLEGPINEENINNVISKIQLINKSNNKSNITLIINSNGGEVYQTGNLITFMMDSSIYYDCIAFNAQSAAFSIFQFCNKRWITPQSILMQHQAVIDRLFTINELKQLSKIIDVLELYVNLFDMNSAIKMDISLHEFNELIFNEFKVKGKDIIKYKLADTMVHYYD